MQRHGELDRLTEFDPLADNRMSLIN
ncbi:MAG: hypothetical protein RIQ93_2652, partial [Verrucomicrobiota bacterium]